MTAIAYATIGAALLLGFTLGYVVRPFLSQMPLDRMFMERIVNQEAAEERRNQVRRMLHDSNRRTMRLDGGKPAKVYKMRRKRRTDWDPM